MATSFRPKWLKRFCPRPSTGSASVPANPAGKNGSEQRAESKILLAFILCTAHHNVSHRQPGECESASYPPPFALCFRPLLLALGSWLLAFCSWPFAPWPFALSPLGPTSDTFSAHVHGTPRR